MTRVSFKKLREWVNKWNEGHPEHEPFTVSDWNGYYHIGTNGSDLIGESTPGRAWEMFTMWKYGYMDGVEAQAKEFADKLARIVKENEE